MAGSHKSQGGQGNNQHQRQRDLEIKEAGRVWTCAARRLSELGDPERSKEHRRAFRDLPMEEVMQARAHRLHCQRRVASSRQTQKTENPAKEVQQTSSPSPPSPVV